MPGITLRDGRKETTYGVGQHVHRGRIDHLEIGPHHEAIIHERPNVGGGARTPMFQAGPYHGVHNGYGWMDKREPHLIEVFPTAIEPRELLKLVWWKKAHWDGKYKLQHQFLPPGDFDVKDNDFKNDVLDMIIVPDAGCVEVFDDSGFGGRHVTLGPGKHDLKRYNIKDAISSLRFQLDDWEELGIEVGKPSNLEKIGETKIQNVDVRVPAGRSKVTATINTTRVRKTETSWETNSKITSSTKISGGIKFIEIEEEITTELEAKAAGSEFNSDETGFGIEIEVEPDENDRVKGTLLVDVLKGTVPLKKKLRNKRTNEVIYLRGETEGEILESRGNFVD